MNDRISRNVRRFRNERQLSMGEVARRAGISKQTLSKIEAGAGNPTVETVERLSAALGVKFKQVLTEWGVGSVLARGLDALWEEVPAGRVRSLEQIYGSGYVRTQVLELKGPAAEWWAMEPHTPGTLHQLYVIEGMVEAGDAKDPQLLRQGDFLRFAGDAPHVYRAVAEEAVVHLTTTAPHVPQYTPLPGDVTEG